MISTMDAVVDIDRPVDEVYRRWTDFDDLPDLLPSVERVERVDDDVTHWDARVGGLRRSFYATTVEEIPDQQISWTSDAGRQHNGIVMFTRLTSDRTRLELRLAWVPESFLERTGARLGIARQIAERDLARFTQRVEDAPAIEPPVPW